MKIPTGCLGWLGFTAVLTVSQIVGITTGRWLADRQFYAEGHCKINGIWNPIKICREKGIKGAVWQNYDGTYRPE